MRIPKKTLIWSGAAALVVAGLAYPLRPRPLVVDTTRVVDQPIEDAVDADGRTRVRDRYVIVAPVTGRIERIEHVEGDVVRRGDVIARLAPLPLDSAAQLQAAARLDAASSTAMAAASQARVAEATLDQRRRDLGRAQRLADVGGISPQALEEARLAMTEASEAARSANARADAADADVRQARAALEGRLGSTAYLIVRCPADGRVLRIAERSERVVTAGTPLLEIGDPSSLEIVVDVLSSDGAAVHSGDRVRLDGWTTDSAEGAGAGWGRVRDVEPSGFTKVSALGIDEQRVNVIIDPTEIPPLIGDGFRVDAHIVVWSSSRVLAVPRSALLQSDRAGWETFVVRNGRAERRPVRIGHVGGSIAEVVAGLARGDEVIVFPSDQVAPGVRVTRRPP